LLGFFFLHSMKDAFAEQRKARFTIPLSFDQFQLSYLPFDHAIIDPPGETISHRVFVFLDPSSKGLKFRKGAALHLGKPGIKTLSGTRAQHLCKLLNEIIGLIDLRMELAKLLLLLDMQFFWAMKEEKGSLP